MRVGRGHSSACGPYLLCHSIHAFLLQCQPQAGHYLLCRLALHLGHVGEDLALQFLQLSFHLLPLEEPGTGCTASEKELTDPGGELRLHLGEENKCHTRGSCRDGRAAGVLR